MNFLMVFCYILFAYGIANMVCYAEGSWGIFEWWREVANNISEGFGKLFTCMMCFSTWVGLVFSIVDLLIPAAVFTPFNLLLDAGFTSGVVWLIHNFEEACERHGTIGYIDENEDNK